MGQHKAEGHVATIILKGHCEIETILNSTPESLLLSVSAC